MSKVKELPYVYSTANGTCVLYTVEARLDYPEPRIVGNTILDDRWRRINFKDGVNGVPKFPSHLTDLVGVHCSLLSFNAAQAMRWWFLAVAEAEFSDLCIETRLVKHTVTHSREIKAEAYVAIENHETRKGRLKNE